MADIILCIHLHMLKKDELQNALINLFLFLTIICWCWFGQRKIYLKTEELTSGPSPRPAFDLLQRQNNNHLPRVDDVASNSIEQELRRPHQHPPSSFWIEEEEEQIETNCNSIDIDLAKVEKNHWAYYIRINRFCQYHKSDLWYSCDRYR